MKWYDYAIMLNKRISSRLWCHMYNRQYHGPPTIVYVYKAACPTTIPGD